MRRGRVCRKTRETEILVDLILEGVGDVEVNSGIGFLDHMLKSLATHSLIDLKMEGKGDLKHHVMEDTALCLGEALREAVNKEAGINRFGYAIVPMDCSLALSSVDLVKRPYSKINLKIEGRAIEDARREDIIHFFETLASSIQCNIHLWTFYGKNDHHKVEAAVKALALSLRQAVALNPRRKSAPSAKGSL